MEKVIHLYDYRPIPQNFGEFRQFDPDYDTILQRGALDLYELSPKKDEWLVTRDWAFWSARLQAVIYIPGWFVTDLASIPRAIRPIVPKNEHERIPALIHDYLYALHGESQNGPTRAQADAVFRDFCDVCGVSWLRRNAMYLAVRSFGWARYNVSARESAPFFQPLTAPH